MKEAAAVHEGGFTLVELMVGIVVSLICTLAIMSAFAIFEGQKRTTTNGDDAQQNGSFALYTLERQIRTAGSGLVQGNRYSLWGCPIAAQSNGSVTLPSPTAPPAPFASWPLTTRAMPVVISSGGTDASGYALPDIIGIVSGSAAARVFSAAVSSTPSNSSVILANSFGINKGDYLLGTLTTGACALALSSSAPDALNTINLNTTYSLATGLVTATNVFDLGPYPVVSLYGVDLRATTPATSTYQTLVTYDLLQRPVNGVAAAVTPLADGIVMVKALYGIHNGTNPKCIDLNCIDAWVAPTGAWDISVISPTVLTPAALLAAYTAMGAIKAVRVVVVAQSRISQRAQDYAGKSTLTLFSDLPLAQQVKIKTDTTYRYKVYDTTTPIRNSLIVKYF